MRCLLYAARNRLRCGGLRGLASQVDGIAEGRAIGDIAGLLTRLPDACADSDAIAWDRVMREISAWRPPARRNRD